MVALTHPMFGTVMVVQADDSSTNNNQEGFNCKINKELKQIHPNPWILTSFIRKQIKLSEQDLIKIQNGLSKPKKRKLYKKLAKRRKNLKKNYQITKDIPTFLAAMGSNLLSAELAAGNNTDTLVSQNANTADNNGDESTWRGINVSEDEEEEDEVNPGNNPYADRRIGKKPQAAINVAKHKCQVCGKEFNARSTFIACHVTNQHT